MRGWDNHLIGAIMVVLASISDSKNFMKKSLMSFLIGLLILPASALILGRLGLIPVHATAKPSRWETAIAQSSLKASLARRASGTKNPLPASDEILLAGMKIFRNDCAGCHGESGRTSHWGTTNFYPRVPQFAETPPELTAEQMFLVVKHGIRYSGMGGWNGEISDSEIWKVVTFLSKINSLPPRVQSAWKAKQ
jgi:thiosulfate dehydrogenase